METIGKIFSVIISMIVVLMLRGFIITKLWAWFIVSLFNLPTLTIASALGISLVCDIIIPRQSNKSDEIWSSLLSSVLLSLLVLLFGWIIYLFI
ncbi:MAG: hypothetical protein M0R17_04900 [Candidatus Omnitrophica bacterium]|jgi:cytochrome bd-type quinol oxidase subunit 2|nr:hypothetical protein [Candidatus Omnitrophota bacterium]